MIYKAIYLGNKWNKDKIYTIILGTLDAQIAPYSANKKDLLH
jgi:hypothetical protein